MGDPDLLIPRGLGAFLELGTAATIVDLGCGTGGLTSYLARKSRPGSAAIGLDNDREVLRRARSATGLPVVQANATYLPVRSDYADLVICRRLLMNLPAPLEALREMARVARPGGLVAAMEPDFLAECGYSSVPGELDFLRKLLLSTSGGSDLGLGRKTVSLFQAVGLRDIRPMVHSPVVAVSGRPTTPGEERRARGLVEAVTEWRTMLANRIGLDGYESMLEEAEGLDRVRERQLATGEYLSATSFPLWIVRGRKSVERA